MGVDSNIEPKAVFPLRFWCQRVLPAVYDDSLSYYEAVCKMGSKLNEIIAIVNDSDSTLADMQDAIKELQDEFEKFKESGFDDYYQAQVEQWIKDNLDYIFRYTVKQVFFGLTQDGHFVAYIPKSWNDIIFDTGANFSLDTYGRLILRWDVTSTHLVNQTPETRAEKEHGSIVKGDNND